MTKVKTSLNIVLRIIEDNNRLPDHLFSMTMIVLNVLYAKKELNDTHREKLVLYLIRYKNSLKYKIGCF